MLMGKVIRFDEVRGYGFIAPDGGGEDVFVHANVLGEDKYFISPGLRVEFEVTDGDRGPKAYAVHLLNDRGPALAAPPAPPPVIPPTFAPRGTPPASAPPDTAPPDTASAATAEPPVTTPAAAAPAAHAPVPPPAPEDSGDEEMCDVLTATVFSQEITELLLKSAPTVTAAQILDMRAELIGFGRRHGWIEG